MCQDTRHLRQSLALPLSNFTAKSVCAYLFACKVEIDIRFPDLGTKEKNVREIWHDMPIYPSECLAHSIQKGLAQSWQFLYNEVRTKLALAGLANLFQVKCQPTKLS